MYIISVHLLEDRCSHLRTNSPIDSNCCLGCQSEPRGQGQKVHEEWTHNNFHMKHSGFYLRLSKHILGIHSFPLQHYPGVGLLVLSFYCQEEKSRERLTSESLTSDSRREWLQDGGWKLGRPHPPLSSLEVLLSHGHCAHSLFNVLVKMLRNAG